MRYFAESFKLNMSLIEKALVCNFFEMFLMWFLQWHWGKSSAKVVCFIKLSKGLKIKGEFIDVYRDFQRISNITKNTQYKCVFQSSWFKSLLGWVLIYQPVSQDFSFYVYRLLICIYRRDVVTNVVIRIILYLADSETCAIILTFFLS